MEVLSDLLRKSAEVTSAICNWVGDQVNRAGSGWIWPNAFRHRAGWRPIMGQWNPNPRRRADMKFGRITPVVKFWYGKFYRGHTKDIIDVDLFWRSTVKEKDSELLGYKFRYKEGIKSKISLGSQISSAGFNLGFGHLALVLKVMAAAEGGGDQGTINAIVAHPKPSGASSLPPGSRLESELQAVLVRNQSVDGIHDQATGSRVLPSSGNHDGGLASNNLSSQGPTVFTEGEVVDEEEDAVEIEIEENEVQKAGQWTILARFYSLKFPNQSALFEDMRRAWRLRAEMSYKSLKDNLFIVSFNAEGDYNFVLQGDPWLHRGDALLVAEFNGLLNPSMVNLDTVPIWVRIYDLPLVMMNRARGELYGSKMGKVREVDVQEDGCNKHDFFRIRVDLPVNRPLRRMLAIKIKVQGKEETRRFHLRYERVPHFCFFCGFIGHSDKECEKRLTNENEPLVFSAELRCSPLKPFERKVGKVKAVHSQGVQRKLSFRGPGSVSSSSAGIRQDAKRYEDQPTRVDAFDGFDIREGKGEDSIDSQLADQTNMLHVSEVSSLGQKKGKDLVSKETSSIPSMEMIPAIRDLNVQQVSFGDGSTEEFGSPTKRKALPTTKSSGIVQQAVLEYGQRGAEETASSTRAMKRLKKGVEANTGVEDMEATSLGAAGKLAGPMRGSRQEK